jgi:hypothetical protein
MTYVSNHPKNVKRDVLFRQLLAAQKAADAVRGPTDLDYFQGEARFDYIAADGHTLAHHFESCPYCKLRELKRAYRRAVDPNNERGDVVRSINKLLERARGPEFVSIGGELYPVSR